MDYVRVRYGVPVDDEDFNVIMARAEKGLSDDFVQSVLKLSDDCEAYAPLMAARGDEALATSMEFVVRGLRRVAARELGD